jgi:hypothetical protein
MPPNTRARFEAARQGALTAVSASGDTSVPLTLVQVEGLPRAKQHESFRLVLEGPPSPALEQGLYFFEHPELEREAIFLVPIGKHAAGFVYEAVFNRG